MMIYTGRTYYYYNYIIIRRDPRRERTRGNTLLKYYGIRTMSLCDKIL